MTYRRCGDGEVCRVSGKLALWITWRQGERIRYEIRAGRKGTGRVLATAKCIFNLRDEERAARRMEKKIGKIVIADGGGDDET